MHDSEFNPAKGPPRVTSPALSTSTTFAEGIQQLLLEDLSAGSAKSPKKEDEQWSTDITTNIEALFISLAAAVSQPSTPAPIQSRTSAKVVDELTAPQPICEFPTMHTLLQDWDTPHF